MELMGLQMEGAGWVASKETSIGRVVVKLEGMYSSGKNDFTNGGGGWEKMCSTEVSMFGLAEEGSCDESSEGTPSLVHIFGEGFGSGLESPCFASGAGERAHIQ